jgi:peroxiredoxin
MSRQANVGLVLLASAAVLGGMVWMNGESDRHTIQASQPSESQRIEIAQSRPVASPLLNEVDPTQFLDPIPVGQKAPDFAAKDAKGRTVKLSQFLGKKNVVMVFYSGSKCPVCGAQLSNLQTHLKDYAVQEAEVIAISADDTVHANKSVGEHGLTFYVIPDAKKEIIKKYGVANVARSGSAWPASFVIDKKGIVRLSVADPKGKRLHSNELLPALSKITKKPAPKLEYDQ